MNIIVTLSNHCLIKEINRKLKSIDDSTRDLQLITLSIQYLPKEIEFVNEIYRFNATLASSSTVNHKPVVTHHPIYCSAV